MTAAITENLAPIAVTERIEAMDVLRGFALLGILLMNLEGFVGPVMASGTGLDPALTGMDRTVDLLVYVLVQGKFYTLFSLLFGMGFAVMSQRAEQAGRPFAGVYWRRGLVLLAFGVFHGVFIWAGDILVMYRYLHHHELILQKTMQLLGILPKELIKKQLFNLEYTSELILTSAKNKIKNHRDILTFADKQIEMQQPKNILRRGYTIVRQDNKVIKNASELKNNLPMDIEFYDTTIQIKKT